MIDTNFLIKDHEKAIDLLRVIQQAEVKIILLKEYQGKDFFPGLYKKVEREIEITEKALNRLEKYYLKKYQDDGSDIINELENDIYWLNKRCDEMAEDLLFYRPKHEY